jgi:hypothetical protein
MAFPPKEEEAILRDAQALRAIGRTSSAGSIAAVAAPWQLRHPYKGPGWHEMDEIEVDIQIHECLIAVVRKTRIGDRA